MYPSVDIYEPEPEGWKDDDKLKQQWSEANALQKVRMQKLLDEFYADKEADDDYKLVLHPRGIYSAFDLASVRYGEDDLNTGEDEVEVLARARQEMDDFTEFMMKKYQETE